MMTKKMMKIKRIEKEKTKEIATDITKVDVGTTVAAAVEVKGDGVG